MVTFAIRNKPVLRTLMQIYLAVYMALHNFFLACFARSVFKTFINVLYNQAQAQNHNSHSTPMLTGYVNKNNSFLL